VHFGIIEIGPPLPSQTFVRGNKLYSITQSKMTLANARLEATAKNGILVAIDDDTENSWLHSTFGTTYYFTGLTDQIVEGQFRWSDGSSPIYSNFELGEPNDIDGAQDAVLFAGPSGRWYDWSDNFLAYAIIEKSLI